MRGKRIMVSLVSLVFATLVAIPSAQAQEVSASRAQAAVVPVINIFSCSAWLQVGASALSAQVCTVRFTDGTYQTTTSVHSASNTQHTVAVWVGFRVGRTWTAGRSYTRGRCGLSVDPGETVGCESHRISIRATNQGKWGIARVVQTDDSAQLLLWTPHPLS